MENGAAGLDPDLFVALDPGVSVLAALTSNKPGFVPRLVTGKPVKALNQLYNKQREHQQKQLAKGNEPRFTSHRLDRITTKRNRRMMHYLHTASRRIIELLVAEGIGTLVLGQESVLETRGRVRQEAQPGVCAHSARDISGAAHLQGGGAWHPCNRHRRELHQPGQLPGSRCVAQL